MMVMQTPLHFLPQRRVHYKETYLIQYNNARKKDTSMTFDDVGVNAGKSFISQLRKNSITARHVYTSTRGCISFIRRCVTYIPS
mmetsp:Transcript_37064/g.75576  ORF Transcript_37064/g.75576 Transcript_37064/m.75576 type:complete len:84 (-) Transcript_37064:314-565(-)